MQIKSVLIYVAVMSFAVCGLSACSQDEAHSVDSVQVPDEQGLQCGNNQVVCDGICVHLEDDLDHCGECGNKCSDLPNPGVAEWGCRKNACFARACKAHYHLKDGACVEDDVFHCAGTDCTSLPGWESGYCDEIELCVAETCLEGYLLNTDDTPFCEEYIQDCDGDASVCILPKGAVEMACVEGKCVVSECNTELYHWNAGQTACVMNSVQECGAPFVDCANYAGWNSGDDGNSCALNEDGVVSCIAASCLPGYHVYGGLNAPCELDDHENCGEHGHVCEPTQVCAEGSCQLECSEGLKDCSGSCVDLANNLENCGECGNSCASEIAGAIALACESGICKVNSCMEGYHLYDNICEYDDITNCGSHGNSCMIDNADSVKCEKGQCIVEKCTSGYHIYLNSCEVDSNEHCGSHEKSCTDSMYCSNGKCACASGTACGSSCVNIQNDNNNCGGCYNKCTGGSNCKNGTCQCPSGTSSCSGTCVSLATNSNCGACGNTCSGGLSCIGGSCQCPSGEKYCSGFCVNINNDNLNCGACNNHCSPQEYCSGGKCVDPTPSCPAGLNSSCTACASGYTQCGTRDGYPLCLKVQIISSVFCEEYCNKTGKTGTFGGQPYYYNAAMCSPGQTCYLNSYNDKDVKCK